MTAEEYKMIKILKEICSHSSCEECEQKSPMLNKLCVCLNDDFSSEIVLTHFPIKDIFVTIEREEI